MEKQQIWNFCEARVKMETETTRPVSSKEVNVIYFVV